MTDFDNPGRLLSDLKKILAMHASFGIDSYPLTPGLKRFLTDTRPLPGNFQKTEPLKQKHLQQPGKEGGEVTRAHKLDLADVRRHLGDCTRCALHQGRSRILFGSGNEEADLFLIGEWPNSRDDAEGVLFSGPQGDLLARMLQAINLDMEQVYITNIVKCRASEDKPPAVGEIKSCLPFLIEQIESVNPKVICAMGPLAVQTMLRSRQSMVRLRGRWQQFNGIALMPTFHPSYLLKNPEMKKAAWLDLQQIQSRLQNKQALVSGKK